MKTFDEIREAIAEDVRNGVTLGPRQVARIDIDADGYAWTYDSDGGVMSRMRPETLEYLWNQPRQPIIATTILDSFLAHSPPRRVYTMRSLAIEGVELPIVDGIGEVSMKPDQEAWQALNERLQRRMHDTINEACGKLQRMIGCPRGGNARDRRRARRAWVRKIAIPDPTMGER